MQFGLNNNADLLEPICPFLFPKTSDCYCRQGADVAAVTIVGHFTCWISPSLSRIAERNRCNSQA